MNMRLFIDDQVFRLFIAIKRPDRDQLLLFRIVLLYFWHLIEQHLRSHGAWPGNSRYAARESPRNSARVISD